MHTIHIRAGDRVYTPGNQYGIDVLAYGVIVSILI